MTAEPPATATLDQARRHARSQAAGANATTQPTIPARLAVDLPAGVDADDVLWDESIDVGNYASRFVPSGASVRFADVGGDACLALLVFNAHETQERINVADTVKVQWQAYPGLGSLLLSDMGRVLMTLVEDTSGRHDMLCGYSHRLGNIRRYGAGTLSSKTPAAREMLAIAAAKHGLTRRDLPAGLNLFKGVRVAGDGALQIDDEPRPGTFVVLRAELDVLVLVANAPHPLDDRARYGGSVVRATAWRAAPSQLDADPLRTSTPERARAFERTADYLLGRAS